MHPALAVHWRDEGLRMYAPQVAVDRVLDSGLNSVLGSVFGRLFALMDSMLW